CLRANENPRPLRYLIFRGSIPHPMQSLCTLRNHCRQWPRNTRYQADATPYLGRTSTGWIAPALPGALIQSPRRRARAASAAPQGRVFFAVNVARGPVIVRLDVASFRPTQALQRLAERRNARLCLRIALGKAHQHADPPHPAGLLRLRRNRPRGRAAEKRDELAPFHCPILPCFRQKG